MILVIIMSVFFLGMTTGSAVLWCLLPARSKRHIDYRQRWEEAVTLLEQGGQLTDEQVAKLAGKKKAASAHLTLHRMASWDRAELEVDRAAKGLPPADDLAGMASWDVTRVLKARARAEVRKGMV